MTAFLSPIQAWWGGLTVREQVMLGIAGGLAGVLAGLVLVVQPLTQAHQQARDDYAASMRLYRATQAHAEAVQSLAAARPATAAEAPSLRAVVGSLALRHDLSLARMVPGDGGQLTVNLDRAETGAVLAWLVDLEALYGIRAQASTLDREADGRVSASFVLVRGGA